jgi:hypothetical protein
MHRPNKRISSLRSFLYLLALLSLSLKLLEAQTALERPEVHAEFGFGFLPWSSEPIESLASEDVRTLISGLHKGWSVDKFIDETDQPRLRILTIMDELETSGLVRGRSDYNMRPGFPVLWEQDLVEIEPLIEHSTREFVQIIEDHWDEVQTFGRSLEAGQEFSELQNMYRLIVGGVLLGGMIDVLFDDKTLMPGAPRRARRGDTYYAWMVEGEENRNYLVNQTARVGRHQVFSVGPVTEENVRIQIDVVAQEGPVYETEDARRWRVFTSVFSRDYLLPYIKSQRSDFINIHSNIDASKYSALAEFVAWYYQELVERTAEYLVRSGRIEAPESSYKYALREAR